MGTCNFYSKSGNPLLHNVTVKVIMYMHSHIFYLRKKTSCFLVYIVDYNSKKHEYRLDSLKLIFSACYW